MAPVWEDHPGTAIVCHVCPLGMYGAFAALSAQSGLMKIEGPNSGEIKGPCGNKIPLDLQGCTKARPCSKVLTAALKKMADETTLFPNTIVHRGICHFREGIHGVCFRN